MSAPSMRVRSIRLGQQGRLVIPADLREELGLHEGETLVAWVEDDRLMLRSRRAAEEELWSMFSAMPESMAAELLRERRREASLEASV